MTIATVTIQGQATADALIPGLLATEADERRLRIDPMTGPINLVQCAEYHIGDPGNPGYINAFNSLCSHPLTVKYSPDLKGTPDGITRVTVAGGTGPDAVPIDPDDLRSLRDQCQAAGVPFVFERWGEWAPLGPASGLNADHWYPGRDPRSIWNFKGGVAVFRIGAKHTGRTLDGVLHDAPPPLEDE